MISFEPTEEQKLIQETVAELAKTRVAESLREAEAAGEVSAELREAVQEMELPLAAAPEAVGGQGLGMMAAVIINEELAKGDAATVFGLPGFGPYLWAALELGTEAQNTELLSAWTGADGAETFGAVAWSELKPNRERPGFNTVAKQEGSGWVLSGKKTFVSNAGRAKSFIVFAQVDEKAGWEGIGAFVVPASETGVKIGEGDKTLGLWAAGFGSVEFDGVKVPDSARLEGGDNFVRSTLRFFAKYALTIAARQVGLARLGTEVAREYVEVRKAFGKPIGHFQAIAFTIADRHMDAESSAELVRRAAWAWDSGQPESKALLYTAQAIAHTDEAAMRCGDDCVQLHGGAGFIRELIAEKLMRDTKQMALCGLTAEQADQIATAIEVGGPLSADTVLPTPDAQAVFT